MSFDPKERWRGRFELVNNDLRFMWLGPGPIVLSLGKISLIFDHKEGSVIDIEERYLHCWTLFPLHNRYSSYN